MTIKKTVALLLAVMLLVASTAFAATHTIGTSNGGIQGTCTCEGYLTLNNGSSKDYVTAKTTSGARGKLSVLAKIYWTNGDTTVSKSNDDTSSATATSISVMVYADNQYGIKGLGSHAYTSSDYGTWYGTTSGNY